MVRVCKIANRPVPRFSADDVIDYMVLETAVLIMNEGDKEAAKQEKLKDWKKDVSGLKQFQ